MNFKRIFLLLIFASLILASFNTFYAQGKLIQVSLVNPVQLVPAEQSIAGLRVNFIYGKNTSVQGLDIGLANHNTSGHSKGWQIGIVGLVDADFSGWQDNGVNITRGKMTGFQSGIVNYAGKMSGVQFGFVNYAESMEGLQIGLLNIIKHGGAFPFFPIVNWAF